MNRLALMAACIALLGSQVAKAQGAGVLGVWELDVMASRLPDQFPAVSETRSYTLRDDGYMVVLAIRVDKRGNPEFIQIAAKSDGKDYPQYQSGPLAELQIDGTSTPFTYAETAVDSRTVHFIGKVNSHVANQGTRKISEDGRKMVLDLTAFAPDVTRFRWSLFSTESTATKSPRARASERWQTASYSIM